jgi:hypothetical protein
MPRNPFHDVHHVAWADVLARQIGQEGHGIRRNILFQCPNPDCGRKASVSILMGCGRCFHCPWTFYVYDRPRSALDALGVDTDHRLARATPTVHLDIQPLTARATTYLGERGLAAETIAAFAPVLFECRYAARPCLGWYTTRPEVYEVRELRLGSSFKSAVNGKELTMIPLAEPFTDIVLAEGLLTAMAYAELHQKFDCLYIVLNSITSFRKLARYESLLQAHHVILALDNDPDGRATLDLFRGVYPQEVTIDLPPTEGADWNDEVCRRLPGAPAAPLEQFVWEYDEAGRIRFERSAAGVARRKAYLERVDARLRVSYHDIEAIVDQPGKPVVCWGASSGKTSAIRQFIVRHAHEYILYAARTVVELERLAYDIGCFIGFDNVFVLSAALETYDAYVQQPDAIRQVPVLLVTHERLCLDPPGLLCRLPSSQHPMQAQTGRKHILIDEQPQLFKRLRLSPEQQGLITAVCGGHLDAASAGTFAAGLDSEDPVAAQPAQVARALLSHRTQDDRLSRYRALHWVDIMAAHCQALSPAAQQAAFVYRPDREFTYYYSLSDLTSNLTIFDGTGDLSLPGSPHWTIIKPKHLAYRFRGTVTHLAPSALRMLPRHPAADAPERSPTYMQWLTTTFVPYMTELSRKHTKILLISWRDFKGVVEALVEPVDVLNPYTTLTQETPKTRITLAERLGIALKRQQITNVVTTYYQSGKTRGTSEFSDCDAVLFLGAFFIPTQALAEYNRLTGAQATRYSWTVAELVQGAYRSQLRQDRPVDIYFSGDWPAAVVQAFAQYLDLQTVYHSDVSLLPPADQLRLFLDPDPRAERIFNLLATQASELLRTKQALYTLAPAVRTAQRPDHLLRSVKRMLGKKGTAQWLSRHLGILRVHLYFRPTDIAIAYTYEPEQQASGGDAVLPDRER